MANNVRFSATLDDKVSSGLQKIADKFELVGGKGSAASLFGNVGAKAVAAGFGFIEEAGSKFVDMLGQSIEAARVDEESISTLTASLKANIPYWDGNTAAIERVIQAHRALGFSDEEQRVSLAGLVGATHDVTKALEIQRVAMDLARFKHISLADAGEALTKVEAGSYRILKSLGIEMKAGATSAEALAAVEKVAAGQAEDFANTNAGKLLISQDKVNEAMEKIGYKIMPVVAEVMGTVADAMGPVVDSVLQLVDAGQKAVDWANSMVGADKAAADSTDWLGSKTDGLGGALHTLADGISKGVDNLYFHKDALAAVTVATGDAATATEDLGFRATTAFAMTARDTDKDISKISARVRNIGTVSETAAAAVDRATRQVVTSYETARRGITDAANGFADAMWDPLIAKSNLTVTNLEIKETELSIHSGKLHGLELATAKQHLLDLEKTKTEELGVLASFGDAASTTALESQIKILKATKHMSAEQIAQLKLLEDELDKAKKKAKELAEAIITSKSSRSQNEPRASGGPVMPGQTYTVGESGPETLVMSSSGGYVIPNAGGRGSASGSSDISVVHTHIYLDGGEIAHVVSPYLARERTAAPRF